MGLEDFTLDLWPEDKPRDTPATPQTHSLVRASLVRTRILVAGGGYKRDQFLSKFLGRTSTVGYSKLNVFRGTSDLECIVERTDHTMKVSITAKPSPAGGDNAYTLRLMRATDFPLRVGLDVAAAVSGNDLIIRISRWRASRPFKAEPYQELPRPSTFGLLDKAWLWLVGDISGLTFLLLAVGSIVSGCLIAGRSQPGSIGSFFLSAMLNGFVVGVVVLVAICFAKGVGGPASMPVLYVYDRFRQWRVRRFDIEDRARREQHEREQAAKAASRAGEYKSWNDESWANAREASFDFYTSVCSQVSQTLADLDVPTESITLSQEPADKRL
jgi:hypothetical protein